MFSNATPLPGNRFSRWRCQIHVAKPFYTSNFKLSVFLPLCKRLSGSYFIFSLFKKIGKILIKLGLKKKIIWIKIGTSLIIKMIVNSKNLFVFKFYFITFTKGIWKLINKHIFKSFIDYGVKLLAFTDYRVFKTYLCDTRLCVLIARNLNISLIHRYDVWRLPMLKSADVNSVCILYTFVV